MEGVLKKMKQNTPTSELIRISAGERVASNLLIRYKLFHELLTPTCLLSCRRICKIWEVEASSVLQQEKVQKRLRINFRYSYERKTFVSFNQNRSGRTLREFLDDRNNGLDRKDGQSGGSQFLKDCCTFYGFYGGNVGVEPDAVEFFMNPTSNIRGLYFFFKYDDTPYLSLRNLINLLLRWGKSLKYLHLAYKPRIWNEDLDRLVNFSEQNNLGSGLNREITLPDEMRQALVEYSRNVYNYERGWISELEGANFLPALEVLKMTDVSCIFNIDLLKWSPNLKEFVDPNINNVWNVHTHKQFHKMSTWYLRSPFIKQRIAGLPLESLPKLKRFGFYIDKYSFNELDLLLINQLLDRGQKSLVKLWDILEFFRYPGVVLPRCMKVRRVTQRSRTKNQDNNEGKVKVTNLQGKVLDLAHFFPNIQHLELNRDGHWCEEQMDVIDEFDSCLPLPSILKCTFWFAEEKTQSLTVERIKKIKRLCPELRHIRFSLERVPEQLPDLFRLIWEHFSEIKSLKFHFRYEEPFKKHEISSLPVDREEAAAFLTDEGWQDRLDSAITGLDVETCQNLRLKRRHLHNTIENLRSEPDVLVHDRNKPALLDMKNLQNIEIKIGPFCSPFRLFSANSFHFGFDMMREQQNFGYNFPSQLL